MPYVDASLVVFLNATKRPTKVGSALKAWSYHSLTQPEQKDL